MRGSQTLRRVEAPRGPVDCRGASDLSQNVEAGSCSSTDCQVEVPHTSWLRRAVSTAHCWGWRGHTIVCPECSRYGTFLRIRTPEWTLAGRYMLRAHFIFVTCYWGGCSYSPGNRLSQKAVEGMVPIQHCCGVLSVWHSGKVQGWLTAHLWLGMLSFRVWPAPDGDAAVLAEESMI